MALLDEIGAGVDMESFLAGESSPVLFGAALPNFGVRRLLEGLCELAPPPAPRADVKDEPRAVDAPFAGLVFKVQANMDRNHRDRVAFVRVCSGRFERGMVLTHAATGRPFATKYAQSMFGQERETVDVAYPGDVIGLVNADRPAARGHAVRGRGGRVPADPELCPRALRRRAQQGREQAQAVPQGASSSSAPKASCRSCPPICAVTRPRCSPRSARCSSTWSCTGWSTSSGPGPSWSISATPWPGGPTPRGPPVLPGSGGPRSLPVAWTGRCSPCSRTSGGWPPSSVSTRHPAGHAGGRHRVAARTAGGPRRPGLAWLPGWLGAPARGPRA